MLNTYKLQKLIVILPFPAVSYIHYAVFAAADPCRRNQLAVS